jgi:Domain of unknown function (DUF4399)
MKRILTATLFAVFLSGGGLLAGETVSAPGTKIFFTELKDGDVVTSPVKVVFGLSGMDIAPAGTDKPNTGHHHVLVDREQFGKGPDGAAEADANIPSDEKHLHFGKGQTETMIELQPGAHTLQLVFGDKDHIPHNPPIISEMITITVK